MHIFSGHISSKFPSASELLEILEEMFPRNLKQFIIAIQPKSDYIFTLFPSIKL